MMLQALDYFLGLKYPISIYPEDEGGYTAMITDLPGCIPHSAGSSRDKIVFLTGRAKKGKNMFVIGGQINDSFLL
jgi:hypothetical protein